jgi:alkanesulfonate monooxygenase SsuD/methylene tetrahydromethanopterin reductase-like flavin-dependent oxidoreductase (luciferase family)
MAASSIRLGRGQANGMTNTPARRPLEFGYFPVPNADDFEEISGAVALADELGLDLIGIQDHPYQRRYLDTWTLIAFLAARTRRIRFFPDVACLPLRPPAVLAKATAALDRMTGGRVELGLGTGAFWEAIEAMGGERHSPADAVAALEEAIAVVRLMWSDESSVRFTGRHYRLAGVKPGPSPAHDIGIWLGAYGPKMLALTGRAADGWLPSLGGYLTADALPERQRRIDDAAEAAGRDPTAIRRALNVAGVITDGPTDGPLRGPVDQWIDELSRLATEGRVDTFILWPEGEPAAQIRRFAEEVVPEVRRAAS